MAAPKKVDYAQIEAGWRAGIRSPRQLAADYEDGTGDKVSHTSITKHFTKMGVPRDLKAKINAKAVEMVNRAMVDRETLPREAEIIEANAQVQANTLISHRQDIKRGRELAMKLLSEVEAQTDNPELFKQLGLILATSDEKGVEKLNDIYMKVISTPGRIDSMKKLSETLKNLIALERQALGLASNDLPQDGDDRIAVIERVIVKA